LSLALRTQNKRLRLTTKTPMTLPKQIKIAGQNVKIRVGKLENAYGQYEHDSKTIWISDLIKNDKVKKETLRHEMMEASLLLSGVGWMQNYDQESVVRCMEEIFFPAWDKLKI
jgi:hypothetical protein